jgi:hypothetical protein
MKEAKLIDVSLHFLVLKIQQTTHKKTTVLTIVEAEGLA